MSKTVMWAIQGRWTNGNPFLYCGTYLTRHSAIAAHEREGGKTWKERRKAGDRAVRVTLTWDPA